MPLSRIFTAMTSSIPTPIGWPVNPFVLATTIPTYATPTRAIWNGYTGAAGWMFRQTLEGVLGLRLSGGRIVPPPDPAPPGGQARAEITRDPARSPLPAPTHLRQGVQHIAIGPPTRPA